MNVIFETIDKIGKKIRLTDKQWAHVVEDHPYMANHIEEMKETIEKADKITISMMDENVRYYYKYYKNKKGFNKYSLVIVKYLNGDGFVISSYFVNKIK